MTRKRVAVIGATGIAGQQFVAALENHPWFEMTALAASRRSAGKLYLEALREPNGAVGWWADSFPGPETQTLPVQDSAEFDPQSVDIIFTAAEFEVPGKNKREAIQEFESRFARHRPTISTTSAFRYEDDVPVLIPGVNDEHASLLKVQQSRRGWDGFIMPIPNCTTTGLAITLKPIYAAFGLKQVVMTSMQAISGAGRRGGVLGLDILDNVIPYIAGEEEKVQIETRKILGACNGERVGPADFIVSCTCTRVNVQDGHTESVFLTTERPATVEQLAQSFGCFGHHLEGLPSAPPAMIVVHDDPFRPQPRRDRDTHDGMATVVGRLRAEPQIPNAFKYVLCSHNTKMGAAKGAVLAAELLVREGYIG